MQCASRMSELARKMPGYILHKSHGDVRSIGSPTAADMLACEQNRPWGVED